MRKHTLTLEVFDDEADGRSARDVARLVMEQINDLKQLEVRSVRYDTESPGRPMNYWASQDDAYKFRAVFTQARRKAKMSFEDLSYWSGYAPGTLKQYETGWYISRPKNFLCLDLPLGLAPNTLHQFTGIILNDFGLKSAMKDWQLKLAKTKAYQARNSGVTRDRTPIRGLSYRYW